MNIGSPIFVPRNSAPMASTSAAIKTVVGTLEPKSPYASPRAISPTTVGQNMDTNNNVEGYWPLFNNATAFYSCDVNSNYLQYCQQKQQQYFQNFFQRQRTLPNFHIQWTQRKAINAAIGQRQQRKVTKAAAMAAEVTSSPSQQSRKKQKTQQQATKQQLLFEQQQQQQVDATKFTTKDKTTDISNDSFSPLSNSATMLLLLKSTAEIVSIDVANENVLSENNKNKHKNNDNVVIPKEDGDVNMTTLTPISDAIAALPNQSNQISKLVAEPEEPTKKVPNAQHVPVYGVHPPTHRYYQPHQHLNNGMQCHYKGNVSDSSRARNNPNNQRRVPAQQQQQQQPQPQYNAKPRKARFNSKRPDNNGASTQKRTTDFAADDYFAHQRVYTYNRQYMSSRAEDNILAARHNPAHRSSTSSSGVAASDDLVSSSSNEDLSTVYSVISQPDKKAGKETGRRSRQQHHRKRHSEQNLVRIIPINGNEDIKENRRPGQQQAQCQNQQQQQQQQQQPSKTANLNLRKTAALKAANTHTACSNTGGSTNAKSSKAASTSSETSSVSSSPTNSANCSPTASPTASKRNVENLRRVARAFVPRVQQHTKLNMSEGQFVQHLQRYVIDPNLLRIYGYPVESAIHEGCIEVQKCFPRPSAAHPSHTTSVVNIVDGLEISRPTSSSSSSDSTTTATTSNIETQSTVGDNSSDSGQGSANSTPPSLDSDSSEAGEDEPASTTVCFTPNGQFQIFSQYDQSLEKQCVRCMRTFHVTESGEYLTHESCTFHWGKLHFNYVGNGYASQYTCCGGTKETEGCSHNYLHVWTGAVVGINGPYKNFVQTRLRSSYKSITPKVYALDTEMSFTGRGLEVTKVTMVGYDGQLVYEHFVRPDNPVVDYNTRFSGITEKDISRKDVKTLEEVQKDLLEFIDAETIVIGHALDNDLRVLRIVHKNIIDTSITFPHPSGFPYRRALKNLTKSYLHRDIQCSDAGHNSFEDSMACLELMMWKVRKDTLRPTAY